MFDYISETSAHLSFLKEIKSFNANLYSNCCAWTIKHALTPPEARAEAVADAVAALAGAGATAGTATGAILGAAAGAIAGAIVGGSGVLLLTAFAMAVAAALAWAPP